MPTGPRNVFAWSSPTYSMPEVNGFDLAADLFFFLSFLFSRCTTECRRTGAFLLDGHLAARLHTLEAGGCFVRLVSETFPSGGPARGSTRGHRRAPSPSRLRPQGAVGRRMCDLFLRSNVPPPTRGFGVAGDFPRHAPAAGGPEQSVQGERTCDFASEQWRFHMRRPPP